MARLLHQVFGSAPDERAVLSVCAVPDPDLSGSWVLRHGTMLIVPQACGQTSWAEWRRDQGDQGGPEIDGALPASFRLENEGYLFARAVLDPVAANDWLERALAGASGGGERGAFSTTLPAVDPVPALAVESRLRMPWSGCCREPTPRPACSWRGSSARPRPCCGVARMRSRSPRGRCSR